nr:MAG TPA: hypothetical protein [Caudoviricetes sp.]
MIDGFVCIHFAESLIAVCQFHQFTEQSSLGFFAAPFPYQRKQNSCFLLRTRKECFDVEFYISTVMFDSQHIHNRSSFQTVIFKILLAKWAINSQEKSLPCQAGRILPTY